MADQPLILIIEDEKSIRRFLKASFTDAGYRFVEAETGKQGLMLARNQPPDLVILDLGLPDIDGLLVIEQIRDWSQMPIIILSARDQEKDKVIALDRGADDYLAKPFGTGELLARLRVALRHRARLHEGDNQTSQFTFGDVTLDLERRRVTRENETVHLTPIEYRLLTTLAQHADKVLTHRFLLREVWGPGHAEEAHYLRVFMANLRRKLEADPARPRHLMTEQGVGYRLVSET